jgi:hypothetical protein
LKRIHIVIFIALLLGLLFLFNSKSSKSEPEQTSASSQSPPPKAVVKPAPAPAPEVRVDMDARVGRASMKIVNGPSFAESAQGQTSLIERFRLPSATPLSGAESFEMMKLKAVLESSYRPEMGERIEEKFGFVIFASRQSQFNLTLDGSLPVVAKIGNGVLGIVTGTIIVTLTDSQAAKNVANAHGLNLKFVDLDLKLAYYSAPATAALDQVAAELKANSYVEQVTLEVVQARKRL